MCCFSCSSSDKHSMSQEMIRTIIEDAKNTANISQIGFTGGEPFMQFELLKDSMAYAYDLGLSSSITTNGIWAKNKNRGYDQLSQLKKLGLKSVFLSYDEFHEEYIAIETIQNAIDICRDLKLYCELGFCFIQNGKSPGYFMDLIGNRVLNLRVTMQPMIPIGRAMEFYNEEDFINNQKVEGMICPNLAAKLSYFDAHGNFYPCCSQVIEDTYLTSGNIQDHTFSELLNTADSNMFLYVLYNKGFDFYCSILKQQFEIELPQFVTSPCELCHRIFSNLDYIQGLLPYVQAEVESILYEKHGS